MKQKIVIIGAGPAGLSAAWKLSERGYPVEVLEKESQVGGQCISTRRDGFTFDLGGHRFISKDDALADEVRRLMGDELLVMPRKSVVRLMGKYFFYPLGGKDLITKMNPLTAARCFLDYIGTIAWYRIFPREDITFEDWVVKRFGRSLYNIYFKPYSEKLWGIAPRFIAADWAAQRISLLNLWDVFLRLFGKLRNEPKTYAMKFYYPRAGIGAIAERMAERTVAAGGAVHLNTCLERVNLEGDRVKNIVCRKDGKEITLEGDVFVFSNPLPELMKAVNPAIDEQYRSLADSMPFRGLRFLNIFINADRISDNTWIYIPEKEYIFFRIQEPKNWSPFSAPEGKTSLILEIACNKGDELWNSPDEYIFKRCIEDLKKIELLDRQEVTGYFSTRMEHAYPIYDLQYRKKMQTVFCWLSGMKNLVPIGRQGLYRYNNMDHSIKMGFLAAEHIAEGLPRTEIFKVASEEVSFEMER